MQDPLLVASILWRRQRLRVHERWTRERVLKAQARALARCRQHAVVHSSFYRDLHRGFERAPLNELPVVTKQALMARFDAAVTDETLRLAELQRHLALRSEGTFQGRYWVASTSGSSGHKAVIPTGRSEWATVIASYARASDWSGGQVHPWTRTRMAVVSSTAAWHQSSQVARSVHTPFNNSVRYNADAPLAQLVDALNRQQPDILVGYSSALQMLAVEQLEGRLRIRPRSIDASSEVFGPEARKLVTRAFGVQPFEVYAATETGGIAAECARHGGLHLFEDLVILESVDDAYRPVPVGEPGARALVTVLHAKTLPLIRYELTDRVRLSSRTCSCGLPFALLESIEGRSDDVVRLPGTAGRSIQVPPVLFERVLEETGPVGWQVRVRDGSLEVRVVADAVPDRLVGALQHALEAVGVRADVGVRATAVSSIEPGAAGKRPRFVVQQ